VALSAAETRLLALLREILRGILEELQLPDESVPAEVKAVLG